MKDPKCRHAIAVSIEPSIMNMFLRLAYDPHTPLGLDVSQMDFLRAAVAAYNLGLETRVSNFSLAYSAFDYSWDVFVYSSIHY